MLVGHRVGHHLQAIRSRRGGVWIVRLSGVIDETVDFKKIASSLQGPVILDLDEVTSINSFGVREWVLAQKYFASTYTCFIRCRPPFAWYFNTVQDFGGSGQLVSFYAPYSCPRCDTHTEVLLDARKQFSQLSVSTPPEAKCPACGAAAEFDDVPEEAFFYFTSHPRPSPPAAINAAIDVLCQNARHLSIEMNVRNALTVIRLSGSITRRTAFQRLADGLRGDVLLVVSSVTETSDDAVAGLRELSSIPNTTLYVSGVTEPLAKAILRSPADLPDTRLVSVLLPFQCEHCLLDVEEEVPNTMAFGAVGTANPSCPPCPQCGKRLSPSDSGWGRALAAKTRWAPMPRDVADYLCTRESASTLGSVPPTLPGPPPTMLEGLGGTYRILRLVSTGGMAEVYQAQHIGPGGFERLVAVKRLLPQRAISEQYVKRFFLEARLAARLSHPNVVQVFALGSLGDQPYLVMEYVDGWDLCEILQRARKLGRAVPPQLACRVVADLCAGLSAGHGHVDEAGQPAPIVHRDVSPHNVLVSFDGHVKLIDFGIARDASTELTPTREGAIGKLNYLPPECLARKAAPLDPRRDIYSTGVTLYECLVGELPFRRDSDVDPIHAILTETAATPSSRRTDLPTALDAIVLRAMARDPENRYSSVLALLSDLDRFASTCWGRPAQPTEISEWLGQVASAIPLSAKNDPSRDTTAPRASK
jgi:serine/threonine protein kinase/anti-anti-sigma regulatory factor